MTKRILGLLHRSEDGMALVVALLVLGLVSIVTASVIAYTTVNQQDSASKKSGLTAYSLAQAALSNASAQLTAHYYDSSGQPDDNSTSLATQAQSWQPSGSQQSPTSTTACTTTSTCMTWSGVLNCPSGVSCPGGGSTITVSGVERAAWHLTGTGKVPNPSGPGLLTRTITVDVPVNAPPAKAGAPDIFKSVYSGTPPSSGCDMTAGQGVTFASPVYVRGNLCLQQTGSVSTPATLVVGGWLSTSQQASVGSTSSPISSLAVGGSCDGSMSSSATCGSTLTKPAGKSYYTDGKSIYTSAFSSSPTFPTLPSVQWSQIQTDRGTWSCTGGRNLDGATFDLTGSPYSCTTQSGSMSWDGTTLTINGNVYLGGNLTSSSTAILYQGLGSIYAYGTVTFANNTQICVDKIGTSKDCYWQAAWPNIANNFLLILSHGVFGDPSGVQPIKNLAFEGGIYSDAGIGIGTGNTYVYGPMVTPQSINPGQQAASGFPNIYDLFTGAPGTPQPYWQLGAPQNGTY